MKSICFTLLLLVLGSCATLRSPTPGFLYTDTRSPVNATANPAGTRVGEACSNSYLSLIAFGDASIETARRNGGITMITSVDETSTSILGFVYGKYCVVVRGR